MDLRQLKTLIAIAEHGSFQRAAEAVSLTPSAISQQIHALETEIGAALFDRSTRPAVLTAQGVQLLDTARAMVALADGAMDAMHGRRAAATLTLGAVRSSAFGLLPAALVRLRERFPELRISIRSARSDELLFDVLAGRLDAAILPEHAHVPQSLRWHAFLREPLHVIAPPGSRPAAGADLLGEHPFIRYKRNVPLAHLIDAEMARMGIRTQASMEIDSMYAIVTCVAAGLGVSVVPRLSLAGQAGGRVVSVPFGRPQVRRRIGIIERAEHPQRAAVSMLRDELAAQAGAFGLRRRGASAVAASGE